MEYKKLGIGFSRFIAAVILVLIAFNGLGFPQTKKSDNPSLEGEEKNIKLDKESLAWQMEEILKWLIQTRDLAPRPKNKPDPFFVLDEFALSGSVTQNRFTFSIKGSVISDEPMFVPMFGYPHQVMLKNVTINNEPAVVGFAGQDYYFVRTKLQNFMIRGEMALRNELSFSIPGPVNFFTANLSDGRVVEGNTLPGLNDTVIHLETGKTQEKNASNLPPLFQVSRAIRIQKEITFEYQVRVRSGSEISTITLPLRYSEIVLEVPGINGWKQSNGELVAPVSGRDVILTVQGRLPKITPFETDPRSAYEWWLIESDMEHRVWVNTPGKQVDSSESPIQKQLSSPKLYLLAKGQKIELDVRPLTTLEALAVVISNQNRMITWTKDGDLVTEDYIQYRNNGIDYIPFDCKGQPIYFEIDGVAHKILSENPDKKNQVLIPLEKGEHITRVQSITRSKPGFFGGILNVPVPSHSLTTSRSSVSLGLPNRIIPLWFTGGQGIKSPIGWIDLICILISLALAFFFFKEKKVRIAGFISICGVYFIFPMLFYIAIIGMALAVALRLVWRYLMGWKRWVTVGAGCIVILAAIVFFYGQPHYYYSDTVGSAPGYMESKQEYSKVSSIAAPVDKPAEISQQIGQRVAPNQQADMDERLGNVYFSGKNVIEGVTPVALPMPGYDRLLNVSRELVTSERPLSPTLIYVTSVVLYPFLLFWLLCLVYTGIALFPVLKPLIVDLRGKL